MKSIMLMLALVTLTTHASESVTNPQPLTCRVDKIEGRTPRFFGLRFPELPLVGDEIPLDTSGDTIKDLMGTAGRGIPVAQARVLLKRTVEKDTQMDVFHAGHLGESSLNVYALTLTLARKAKGHISLVKNGQVVTLDLICK